MFTLCVFYFFLTTCICFQKYPRIIHATKYINISFSSVAAYGSAHFGQGIGRIIIDDLGCSGNEWGLNQCPSLPWYSHNCGHSEDAGVSCNCKYNIDLNSFFLIYRNNNKSGNIHFCTIFNIKCMDLYYLSSRCENLHRNVEVFL